MFVDTRPWAISAVGASRGDRVYFVLHRFYLYLLVCGDYACLDHNLFDLLHDDFFFFGDDLASFVQLSCPAFPETHIQALELVEQFLAEKASLRLQITRLGPIDGLPFIQCPALMGQLMLFYFIFGDTLVEGVPEHFIHVGVCHPTSLQLHLFF